MRPPPERLERLPEQYFTRLLARVSAAAAADGEPLVDLGRGNPDIPPPAHVIEALAEAAARDDTHGYAPFAGLPALKEAIAARYRDVYGVTVDPEREVAVLPGSKTGLIEFAQVTAERGSPIILPDPGYPDYRSAVALAAAELVALPLLDDGRPDWDAAPEDGAAALYLNYPSNPVAARAPDGVFEETVAWAQRTGTWVLHDFAYGDLVFDGRRPQSFLATDGAREVGLELFSMSKSYGMAGWRLGFAIGNAELVARIENLQNHVFAGVFMPVQHAGIAALTGQQETIEERRAVYEARRDRVLAALAGVDARSEGTFFVWLRLPAGVTCPLLLDEHRVALAPGEGFGARGAGWARLSLATPDDRLDLGLERLAAAKPAQLVEVALAADVEVPVEHRRVDERELVAEARAISVAAPVPLGGLGAEARFDGVQGEVPEQREHVLLGLDHDVVVPLAKEVAGAAVAEIERSRVVAVEAAHSRLQRLGRNLEDQVVVRGHEAERAADPVHPNDRPDELRAEHRPVVVVAKDGRRPGAPGVDVVDPGRHCTSWDACHRPSVPPDATPRKCPSRSCRAFLINGDSHRKENRQV
jgi:L-glutamine---4-(methylsulfanyl)-2-oxobutanoate aminotransferase